MQAGGTHRIAAIDIGTVTTRLLVADVTGTQIKTLARKSEITHLGQGESLQNRLRPEAMDRVCEAVERFLDIMDGCVRGDDVLGVEAAPIEQVVAIATSAARDAENSDDLVRMLADSGVDLQVISGQHEAGLSFLGAASAFPGDHILMADIGGGSTELADGDIAPGVAKATLRSLHSFNLGCRRLTDLFLLGDPPTPEEMEAARSHAHGMLAPFFAGLQAPPKRLVAVAGTATSMVSIDQHMEVYDSSRVHGTEVPAETLARIAKQLAGMPLSQREKVVGLQPDRASVIVAGTVILQEVLSLSGLSSYTVSESDILQGIALDTARRLDESQRQPLENTHRE